MSTRRSARHHQPLDVDRLQQDMRRDRRNHRTDDDKALLHSVLIKQARLYKNGNPARCTPTREERANGQTPHSDTKVIFDSRVATWECIRELDRLFGDTQESFVYPCPRSDLDHFHYTRKPR